MNPDSSEFVLDDKDEFVLDDRDDFYQDVVRLFYQTERDARRGIASLQNAGWHSIILTQLSFVSWLVEGKR